jgi:hypothetical protein
LRGSRSGATRGAVAGLWLLLTCGAGAAPAAESASALPAVPARIELHSADYLLVGLVRGDVMTLRVTRALDNAPVHDAQVTAFLRGTSHPATSEVDGSYTFSSQDLTLPGSAAIEFEVKQADKDQRLRGTLTTPETAGAPQDTNGIRQYAWWVLNFSVCIAAYVLFMRRRKSEDSEGADGT